ncbi:MAG: FtsX-like permease family protein [Acidimicrobiales bacterium]
MNALRRGIRNTFRNSMRTVGVVVILAVAIALSISMLIARDAVTNKINTVRASTGNTITVSPKGFFGFNGGGTPLKESSITNLLSIPNVTAVQVSLSEELTSSKTSLTSPTPAGFLGGQFGFGSSGGSGSSGGFSGSSSNTTFSIPIRVIGTNSPGNAVVGGANGGGTEKLTAGAAYSPTSTADVAIVGSTLATTNKLSVGSTFTAWGTKVTVVGIFNAGSTFTDSSVLMPLATVQKLAGATGDVTSATVVVNSLNNVGGVDKAVTKALGSSADVTSTQATTEASLAPLNSVKTISTYTLIGSVIGAAIILLLSMLMIVRERRREVGVLKALGAPNRSIISQFIAESTTFTILGAIVGFVVGILISSPITSALVSASGGSSSTSGFVRRTGSAGFGAGGNGFTPPTGGFANRSTGNFHFGGFSNTITQIHTSAGWSTLAFALIAAVIIAALGSTVAAATIVRIRPAEVLRSE